MTLNPDDNPHLPAGYLEELEALPERQRQRFREGRYLSEVPGALSGCNGLTNAAGTRRRI